jgi:methyltransferase (TIGR00027 family)
MARADHDTWDLATSARPYRLTWPPGTIVYEVDQPEVVDFKTQTLAKLGAAPAVDRRTVGIDLRHDWPTALRGTGFDTAEPTAWLVEGLLIGFLPPDAHDRLLDNITALSATGSRFAGDYVWSMSQLEAGRQRMRVLFDRCHEEGVDIDLTDLTYSGDRNDVADYLEARGWVAARAGIGDLFASAGLPAVGGDELETVSWIDYATATRT